ncbi:hypothetical protein evm_014975, partial [Chilo suppressalis]
GVGYKGEALILFNNQFKYKEKENIVSLSVEQTIELACVELKQYIIKKIKGQCAKMYEAWYTAQ